MLVAEQRCDDDPGPIRCRTRRCPAVLGVRLGSERVRWIVATEQGPNGHFAALCPICGRRRVWTRLAPASIG